MCLRDVSKVVQRNFQGSFKGVSEENCVVFRETFKGDSRKVQTSLKEVQKVFYGTLKAVSKMF